VIAVAFDYLLGIGALGVAGAIIVRDGEPSGARWADWLAGHRPLRLDEALTGPPPRRPRRWTCDDIARFQRINGVRDWATDAELHEVA